MKCHGLIAFLCFCLSCTVADAQSVSYDALFGKWEYKSPKGHSKTSYDLTLDKKFTSITEHNEKEIKAAGDFSLDKKGDIDRLILIRPLEGLKTRTYVSYYFIRFVGPDTLKVQTATDRQDHWRAESKRNTMTFVRQKQKEKVKDN